MEPPHMPARRLLVLALPLLALPGAAMAQSPPVRLFSVVTPRDEIVIGLTPAELAALGSGPEAERIARRLVAEGQITAWRYVVSRAPDGTTRFAATGRISVLRQDTTRIEPYSSALPVAPPPGG
jgi:hypothetical protein